MNQSIYNIARNLVESKREKNSKYKKFKQSVLAYYGVNTPDELDPAKKKQFYKYIDIEWKRFKTSLDSNVSVSENTIITENLFSRIDKKTYLNVSDENDESTKKLDELLGEPEYDEDGNIKLDKDGKPTSSGELIVKPYTPDELKNKLKYAETNPMSIRNIAGKDKIGIVHKKIIEKLKIRIVDETGKLYDSYDLDKLRDMLTSTPKYILSKNEKMQHGSGKLTQFFNIGIGAMKSLVYDEEKKQFAVIDTCPGAGACIKGCYAMKGNYVMVIHSALSRSIRLNYLLNHPDKYMAMAVRELSNKIQNMGKKGVDVHIRWHDAGDFFIPEYLKIAKQIAVLYPKINFYGYTKVAFAVNDTSLPSNLLIRFSMDANKIQLKQVDASKVLNADTVPFADFKDIFILAKNKKPMSDKETKSWFFNDPVEQNKEKLKQIVANKYSLDISKVLLHDEYMEQRNSLSDEGGYYVIIYPGNSDFPATEKRVKTVYNLEH